MRKIFIMLAATGLGLSSFSHAADLTVQPLRNSESSQIEGYSMLVRKDESLLTRIESSLAPTDREVWWLVFNNPSACATRPCKLTDIYRTDTGADLIRARDEAAGKDGSGNICLSMGSGGSSMMPDLGLGAAGLANVHAAEVQVIVTSSSPGLRSLISRRNGGFAGNCGGGQCSALLVAVHVPRSPQIIAANLGR